MKSYISILFIVVLFAAVLIFQDSSFLSSKKQIEKEIPVQFEEKEIDEAFNSNTEHSQKNKPNIDLIQQNEYENLNPDSAIWLHTVGSCGYSFDDLKNKLTKKEPNYTEKQAQYKSLLLEKCDKWYSYLNSLSDKQFQLFKSNMKQTLELGQYFNNYKPYDNERLEEAKKFIQDGGDGSNVTIGALAHLLDQDWDFIGAIAQKLGTTNLDQIVKNNYDIAMLYSCSVEPAACSANSYTMLGICLNDEKLCGLSYNQYVASTVTSGYFSDLTNIVDIIKMLIKQGYFDETNQAIGEN